MDKLRYTFYGVRGSYPVSDLKFSKYGGNTTSILFESGNDIFIIDAGTGIINIGNYLKKKRGITTVNVFLTHLHIDHILGFPFFNPIYDKDVQINIFCFKYPLFSFKEKVYSLFNQPLSPISKKGIIAEMNFFSLPSEYGEPVKINDNTFVNFIKEDFHPKSGVMMYRVDFFDKRIVFATDIESVNGFSGKYKDFVKGADVLIHDSQYTKTDYKNKKNPKNGYGHSTVDMAVANAKRMEVGKLFLFHFSPEYSDKKLEKMLKYARESFKNTDLSKEGKINFLRR